MPVAAHAPAGIVLAIDPPADTARRVLVVDDDATVSEVVTRYLLRDGYLVEVVADGRQALQAARARPPDLVVLDLMLPGMNGLEVFRELRRHSAVSVVMLSALVGETDRLAGLELGADDYVTKPFSPRELVLRVQAVLRRAAPVPDSVQATVVVDGDLRVDLRAHEVSRAGAALTLTGREYDLLVYLLTHAGEAFSREHLLRHVWGWEFGDTSTVTVHVRRLREKIEPDPRHPQRVLTVFGVGYRYEPTP